MKSHDSKLEPLSDDVRRGIEAFREERPSDTLLESVRHRQDAPAQSDTPRKGASISHLRRVSSQGGMFMAAFALATAAAVVVVPGVVSRQALLSVETHAQEMSVVLPARGGAWVHLPWSAHHHEDRSATVSIDAPGHLAMHLPSGLANSCGGQRCVYSWVSHAPHSANTPLRVQIHEPGRYEFSVVHTCRRRRVHERFIVLAMR